MAARRRDRFELYEEQDDDESYSYPSWTTWPGIKQWLIEHGLPMDNPRVQLALLTSVVIVGLIAWRWHRISAWMKAKAQPKALVVDKAALEAERRAALQARYASNKPVAAAPNRAPESESTSPQPALKKKVSTPLSVPPSYADAEAQPELDEEAIRRKAKEANAKLLEKLAQKPREPAQSPAQEPSPKKKSAPLSVPPSYNEAEEQQHKAVNEDANKSKAREANARLLEKLAATAKPRDADDDAEIAVAAAAPDGLRRRAANAAKGSEGPASPPAFEGPSEAAQPVPSPTSADSGTSEAEPQPSTPTTLASSVLTLAQRNAQAKMLRAAEVGDRTMVEKWHKFAGTPLDAADPVDGTTAMHAAAAAGRREVISWLLQQGASAWPAAITGSDGSRMLPPLHLACLFGHAEAVSVLLGAPLPTSSGSPSAANTPAVTSPSGVPLAVRAWAGGVPAAPSIALSPVTWYPLHLAAINGSCDVITQLLAAGADVSQCAGPLAAPPAVYAVAWGRVGALTSLLDASPPDVLSATYRGTYTDVSRTPYPMGVTLVSAAVAPIPVPLPQNLAAAITNDGQGASTRSGAFLLSEAYSLFGSSLLKRNWAGAKQQSSSSAASAVGVGAGAGSDVEASQACPIFRRVPGAHRQQVLQLLADRGAPLDTQLVLLPSDGGSDDAPHPAKRRPLHIAAQAGDIASLRYLMDKGCRTDDPTLLHCVARAIRRCVSQRASQRAGGDVARWRDSDPAMLWQEVCDLSGLEVGALIDCGAELISKGTPMRFGHPIGTGRPVPALPVVIGLKHAMEGDLLGMPVLSTAVLDPGELIITPDVDALGLEGTCGGFFPQPISLIAPEKAAVREAVAAWVATQREAQGVQ